MMKIIIFIFILVHFHFLHCAKIPELLECVDDSCKTTISTGRVMKPVNPIHGNLAFLKASAKISIKGKNHGSRDTLWLIESDGYHGFIDLSFIKENRESIRNDINVVQNPYYKYSDETESNDETLQDKKLFSKKEESVPSDTTLENDETENFSERNQLKHDEKNVSKEIVNEDTVHKDTASIPLKEQSDQLENPIEKQNTNSGNIVQVKEGSDIPRKLTEDIVLKNQKIEEKQDIIHKEDDKHSKIVEEPMKNNNGSTENSTNTEKHKPQDQKDTSDNVLKIPKIEEKQDIIHKEDDKHSKIVEEPMKNNNESTANSTNTEKHKQQDKKNTSENVTKEQSKSSHIIQDSSKTIAKEILQTEEMVMKASNDTQDQAKEDLKTLKKESVANESIESSDTAHNKSEKPSEITESATDLKVENKKMQPLVKVAPDSKSADDGTKTNVSTKQQHTTSSPTDEHLVTNASDKSITLPPTAPVVPKEIDEPRKTVEEQVETTVEMKNPVNPEPVVVVKEIIGPSDSVEETSVEHIEKMPNPPSSDVISNSVNVDDSKKATEGKINDSLDANTKSNPVNSDPWLGGGTKPGMVDNDKDLVNNIKSPVLKLIVKLDLLSHFLIRSVTERCGLDSSSRLSRFANNWLHMSPENLIFILTSLAIMLTVIYAPKLLKCNRDWQSEFTRQSQIVAELESQLQTIEEVRHKLTVQNHNFEKVIEDLKQQINEIHEDAENNKKTVMGEIAKQKKTHEMNMKALTSDLTNKVRQYELLESEIGEKEAAIEALEDEKRNLETAWEREKIAMGEVVSRLENELVKMASSRDEVRNSLQQKVTETEKLNFQVQELRQALIDKNDSYVALEKSFENLKIFDGMDYEEYMEKREICLELSNTKDRLVNAEDTIQQLEADLGSKCQRISELEAAAVESNQLRIEYEARKNEAVALQEQAETKLQVLSDYFKSKEVEMAKTFGHQVIESSQTLDQVDYLQHRIQILETDNGDMGRTIQKLKAEIKEAQSFAAKCKSDANEQINELFLKSNTLERNLMLEKEENKKLRTKLSHYCGPTMMTATNTTMNSPRGANTTYNHYSNKDRPPSRQSASGESYMPMPVLPLLPLSSLPQSSMQNNQMSGRNSVNSKKSNNT